MKGMCASAATSPTARCWPTLTRTHCLQVAAGRVCVPDHCTDKRVRHIGRCRHDWYLCLPLSSIDSA